MHRLYQLAPGLLVLDHEDRAHEKLIELFRDLFDLRGVCLFDGDRSEIYCTGCARHGFAEQLDRTNMTDLVVNLVEQYARQSSDRTFLVANETTATEILADSDLLHLALRQLLDNACKYSPPGSAVKVSLELQNEQAAVRVSNSGNLIRSNERTRILSASIVEQKHGTWRQVPV